MTNDIKIIQILPQSLSPYSMGRDVRFYEDDWHTIVSKQILKQTRKYDIECWRPETTFKKIYKREADGIIYRIFPSIYLGFDMEYSITLLSELKKESEEKNLLIHQYGFHTHLNYLISHFFKNVPVVGSHLGNIPYTYRYQNSKNLLKKLCFFPLYKIEPNILNHIDVLFVASREEYEFLSKIHPRVEYISPAGIDFEKFKIMDKNYAREILDLPIDKKYILHIGRYQPLKGVDIILDSFKKLKKRYDVELLLVGGKKTDPLYERAVKEGAIVIERIPHDDLIPYYNAADVYLFPAFNDALLKFGGMGIAPIESLACGTPIVARNLNHFIGNWEKIGKIPRTKEDIIECVSEIFDNPSPYSDCRELAKKYYDWDFIIKRHISVYDELFEKYYR